MERQISDRYTPRTSGRHHHGDRPRADWYDSGGDHPERKSWWKGIIPWSSLWVAILTSLLVPIIKDSIQHLGHVSLHWLQSIATACGLR